MNGLPVWMQLVWWVGLASVTFTSFVVVMCVSVGVAESLSGWLRRRREWRMDEEWLARQSEEVRR